jgi:hypothetical protein
MNGFFYAKQYCKINNLHLTDAFKKEVVNDVITLMLLKLLIIKKVAIVR